MNNAEFSIKYLKPINNLLRSMFGKEYSITLDFCENKGLDVVIGFIENILNDIFSEKYVKFKSTWGKERYIKFIQRNKKIFHTRYGIGMKTDHTLIDIGNKFEISRERVRQIQAKTLRLLRRNMAHKFVIFFDLNYE